MNFYEAIEKKRAPKYFLVYVGLIKRKEKTYSYFLRLIVKRFMK